MNASPVRFALVGCGNIAGRHAQCLTELPETSLATVCDQDAGRAAAFAEQHGVPASPSLEELLKRDDIDAMMLALPVTAHAEVGLQCVESGKHVLVEKPVDADASMGQRLVQAATARGVCLSVISQNRFHDGVLWAKEVMTSGALGRPVLVNAFSLWKRDQAYYEKAPGRGLTDKSEGGVLLNQAVHIIDLLQWLFGKAKRVAAHGATLTHSIAVEDTAAVSMTLASGAMATLVSSTSIHPQEPERIEARCEKGTFVLEGGKVTRFECADGVDVPPPPSVDGPAPDRLEPFRRQHRDFARAVAGQAAPTVTGQQALDVLDTVLAAYHSVETGAMVALPFAL